MTEADTGPDTPDPDEQNSCAHEQLALVSTYDLLNIMYQVEEKMHDKSAEEKLGFLVNSISGVIYAISQVIGIESWIIRDGDKTVSVTPTATEIPSKGEIN